MTLKEKLDGKLPPLSTLMWEELEEVFMNVKTEDLPRGVKVAVYKNSPQSHFSYNLESLGSPIGKSFSFDYNLDTFAEVIEIAKENGLIVEPVTEGSHYNFIYSPTWPK